MSEQLCGIQTSRYNGLGFDQELAFAREQGIGLLDVFFDGYLPQDIAWQYGELRTWRAGGKELSVHFPLLDFRLEADALRAVIAFCNEFLPLSATIHFDHLDRGVLELLKATLDPRVRLSVENTIPDRHQSLDLDYRGFMAAFKDEFRLYATFDAGHALVNGQDPLAYLEGLWAQGIEVAAYHVHNNDGRRDAHQAIDQGLVPYRDLLPRTRGRSPIAVYITEHWTDNLRAWNLLRSWVDPDRA